MKVRNQKLRWSKHKESTLINLWAKNVEQLKLKSQKSRVYNQIYNAMKKQGFKLELSDIHAKISALRRKYRSELAKKTVSKWTHFSKMAEIQGSAEKEDKIDSVPDDLLPTTFSSVYVAEYSPAMFGAAEKSTEQDEDVLIEDQPILEGAIPIHNVDQLNSFVTNQDVKPIFSEYELFSQLVANELHELDEDLCIETKRSIFNIICDANIKQLERNSSSFR